MTNDDYKRALSNANNDWADTNDQLKLALAREAKREAAIASIHAVLAETTEQYKSPFNIYIKGKIDGLKGALDLLGENEATSDLIRRAMR